MKFIGIADLHFALYGQDPIVQESGLPERLHYLNQVLRDDVIAYARTNNIDIIVIAGDVIHTKSLIHTLAQSILLDIIRDYRDIKFIIIDGNHDMSSKSGRGVSALKCLDKEKNVTMLHKSIQIDNVAFVPWGNTMFEDIKNATAPYLVSHFGLNEAKLNSGISIISDIGLKDLTHFKHCYLGHYHLPQEVGNVTYLGSIIQMDMGEKHEDKRFMVIDTDSGTHTSILTRNYKRYYALELNASNVDKVIEKAKKLKAQGHHVRVDKIEKVDTSEVGENLHIVDKTEKDITNRGISTAMSETDILKRYIEIREIPEKDRDFILETAIEIIDECA